MTAGFAIRRAAWWGTALFAVTAIAAVAFPDPPAEVPAFVVAVTLFVAGCVVFALGYARAVSRSRSDLIGVADLFFLAGDTAPPDAKRSLLGALAAEVVIAFATAIARPYSSLAAGALAPVYGLSLCGLWASRHGTFQPRQLATGRGSRAGRDERPKPTGRTGGTPNRPNRTNRPKKGGGGRRRR